MRGLLLYLWQRQAQSINEYAIGIDVFGRPPEFDPNVDATVRVGVARLRRKLKEVYEGEMESAPFQLTIPLGGHEIRWIPNPHAQHSRVSIIRALPLFIRNVLLGSIAVATVLAVLCLILVEENRSLKASLPTPPSQSRPPQSRLWRSFLAGGSEKGPIIVVPSPLFFWWPDHGVFVRDLSIPQFQDWMTSAIIQEAAAKWGAPRLVQAFIPVEAVKSAAKIMQYLEGLGQHPSVTDSISLAVDATSYQNTIFLGSSVGDPVTQILKHTNFYLQQVAKKPTIIVNRNPGPGEASEYREVDFSTEHKVIPELIVLSPETSTGTRSLLLLGSSPTVFMSILLAPEGLKLIDEQLEKAGFPDSWEMVIQVEINVGTVLRLQPLAIRRITASFWK